MFTEAFFLLLLFFFFLYVVSITVASTILDVVLEGGKKDSKGILKWIYSFESVLFKRFPSFVIDMTWRQYTVAVIATHVIAVLMLYLCLRLQGIFHLGPVVSPLLALHIAISFLTGTDLQPFNSELTLSPKIMTVGIIPAMFLAAGIGIAILLPVIRSLIQTKSFGRIGNFFTDLMRTTLYVLFPLSIIAATLLSVAGIPSGFPRYKEISCTHLDKKHDYLTLEGPIAAYTAIELLGTNGGGFYTANMAHPIQNPSPLSHVIGIFLMLLMPSSLIFAVGRWIDQRRFSSLLFIAFSAVLAASVIFMCISETYLSSFLKGKELSLINAGLEGKELRFGNFWAIFWSVVSITTPCGACCLSFSSLVPLSLVPLLYLMQSGEVVFGGAGTGCIGIIFYVILAIFTSGLMVGRTPEIFHKKITYQDILLLIGFLAVPLICILGGVSFYILNKESLAQVASTPLRSVTEIIYTITSAVSGNGSSLNSLQLSDSSLLVITCICMWIGRIIPIILALAFAGQFSQKKKCSENGCSVRIDTVLFIGWFLIIIFGVGCLNYLPLLVMGPLFEQFFIPAESLGYVSCALLLIISSPKTFNKPENISNSECENECQ